VIEDSALELLGDARVIGLGTGRAAERFIRALARSRRDLLCVPTSKASETLAISLGLRCVELQPIDVTFDGADEIDADLNLIKGYGGALWREKMVAQLSQRVIILAGEEKKVSRLGARGKLPLEVNAFAASYVAQALAARQPLWRRAGEEKFVTDNGNYILDIVPPAPLASDAEWLRIPGVIASGAFFNLATTALIERGDKSVETLCK
jgi:ribose 5-phosphate isomerase A